jgi:tetratricopeptide (TPR) repeat protein
MYTIKYNRTTNHIAGLEIRSTGGGVERDGYVSDYSQNACGSLTRYRFADGQSFESLRDALEAARKSTRKLCKTCESAALAMLAEAETTGEIVTENAPEQIIEQVEANIERAKSLAEAENADGLAALNKETETLVSTLPTRGKHGEETFAGLKKRLREDFRAAAQVQDKPEPKAKPKAEVKVVDPSDYSIYNGVTELIADGAARVAEGVNLHLKTSDLAKEVAAIMLDMWVRIPNKENHPDILGNSHAAKEAARALYSKAGEGFEKNYDTEEALKKLQRAVQHQRSDVRAQFLRSLDEDQEAAERFAGLLEAKPEDVPVSQFVADKYGTALKGHGEIQRERYRAKAALTTGEAAPEEENEEEAEPTTTPDTRVRSFVQKLKRDVVKAKPEDFESATEETKESVRAELEELYKAVKKMIDATF